MRVILLIPRSSRGEGRDLCAMLRSAQQQRGIASGTASSVHRQLWADAEIHPGSSGHSALTLSPDQRSALDQFRI